MLSSRSMLSSLWPSSFAACLAKIERSRAAYKSSVSTCKRVSPRALVVIAITFTRRTPGAVFFCRPRMR